MSGEGQLLRQVPDLAALRVSNGALKGEQLPSRLKIFNWGENPSTKGTFVAGAKTAALLERNQRALGFERVAIDFNHCTVPGSPEYVKGQPPAIFGYGTVKAHAGDGIWLEDVQWTPLGLTHARNYEDLSPALHPNEPGEEVDFVHSVALTPNGALHDVSFFSADKPNTIHMESKSTTPVLTLAILASAMGLEATASEADVTKQIKSLTELRNQLTRDGKIVILDTVSALEERLKRLEDAGKASANPTEAITALSAKLSDLEKQWTASMTARLDQERGALIARFSSDGKVPKGPDGKPYSAEDLARLDVTTLQILHANTPATVPMDQRGKTPKETSPLTGMARARAAFQAQYESARV